MSRDLIGERLDWKDDEGVVRYVAVVGVRVVGPGGVQFLMRWSEEDSDFARWSRTLPVDADLPSLRDQLAKGP